jgi:hypothetical protein
MTRRVACLQNPGIRFTPACAPQLHQPELPIQGVESLVERRCGEMRQRVAAAFGSPTSFFRGGVAAPDDERGHSASGRESAAPSQEPPGGDSAHALAERIRRSRTGRLENRQPAAANKGLRKATTPDRAKSRNASAFSPHVEPHNDGIVNDPEIKAEASDLVFLKLPL